MPLDQLKPEDLLGTSEVAKVLGVSKQRIHALRKKTSFPKPIVTLAATPIWKLDDVKAFLDEWKPWKKEAGSV